MGHLVYDMGSAGETLTYDVESLWEQSKDFSVREIPLAQVESELDYGEQWFKTTPPTPRAVARHAQRIWDADLNCSIILSPSGMVLDGIHRIAKAWLLGHTHIKAVQFETAPQPSHATEVTAPE